MTTQDPAAVAFEAADYSTALSLLLSESRDRDMTSDSQRRRHRHNVIVTDYLLTGVNDATSLLRSLESLDLASADDVDERVVLRYNRAVLHVRLCEFAHARDLIAPVYAIRSQLDLGLTIKIALLLLDVYVRTRNIEKAESVLEDLTTIKTQLLSSPPSSSEPPVNCTPVPSPTELAVWIHLYQTRIHFMSRNDRSAKKIVKSALQILNKDNEPFISDFHKASALLVKARLECCNDKWIKAIKLLNNVQYSCPTNPQVTAVYLNNLGCVHFAMQRYSAAAFYFQRALSVAGTVHDSSLGPQIRFNRGVQLMHVAGGAMAKDAVRELSVTNDACAIARKPWPDLVYLS